MNAPNEYDEPPSRIPWPAILVAVTIAAGLAIDALAPLPLPWPALAPTVGWCIIAVALLCDAWCASVLWAHHTTIMPNRPVSRLVTEGPYRWSRNPLYVSHVALTGGIGLILRSGWILLLLPLLAFALAKLAIEPEERHLRRKFGADFDAYVARTRRWL